MIKEAKKGYLSDRYEQQRKTKRFTKQEMIIYRLGFFNGQESLHLKIKALCENVVKQRRIIAMMAEEIKRADTIDGYLRRTDIEPVKRTIIKAKKI